MKAGMRLVLMAFAAGLPLGAQALAQTVPQSTPPVTTNTTAPPAHTVGPQELQNFNLGGSATPSTATPPASTAPATSVPPRSQPATTDRTSPAESGLAPIRNSASRAARARPQTQRQTAPVPAPAATLPPFNPGATSGAPVSPVETTTQSPPAFTPEPATGSAQPTSDQGPSMLPWLLAAAALALGVGFFLWRRHTREAMAGGPVIDRYVAPEPRVPVPAPPRAPPAAAPRPSAAWQPTPAPAEPAPAPSPSKPVGIVATRLRPWLDVTLTPVACRFEGDQVGVQFDVELFNSGAAPARDILVEATLFNASATQEQDIGAFMLRPVGEGDRIEAIPPLQRMNFRSSLVVSRSNLQVFEVGDRQVFVPVLAFNAIYRWSGGDGQTSGSYLVGAETGAEKLAPMPGDLDSRTLTRLGGRLLPTAIRR